MDLRLNEFLKQILNDECYATYLIESMDKENRNYTEILRIPRHCFTAHQLRYSTVEEISKSHRTVLLGGIPRTWNAHHHFSMFDLILGLPTKAFKRTMENSFEGNSGEHGQTRKGLWENHWPHSKNAGVYMNDYDGMKDGSRVQPFLSKPSAFDFSIQNGHSSNIHPDNCPINNLDNGFCRTNQSPHCRSSSLHHFINKSDTDPNLSRASMHNDTYHNGEVLDGKAKRSKLSVNLRALRSEREKLKIIRPRPYQLQGKERLKMNDSTYDLKSFPRFKTILRSHLDSTADVSSTQPLSKNVIEDNKKVVGKIVMAEKMLVMMKEALTARVLPSQFSEDEPIDTRIKERWKEYITIVRTTGNLGAPLIIQFYTSRNVKGIESDLGKQWYCKTEFFLDSACYIDFYSLLDKSICIVKQDPLLTDNIQYDDDNDDEKLRKHDNNTFERLKVYILRCHNISSSKRWLSFLRISIGQRDKDNRISLHIPEAEVSFTINLPIAVKKIICSQYDSDMNYLKLVYFPNGYKILEMPLVRCLYFLLKDVLKRAGKNNLINSWDRFDVLSGLCWKHYDRFELAMGNAQDLLSGCSILSKSYILEYRTFNLHTRRVKLKSGTVLEEPDPIEGFLGRTIITSHSDEIFLSQPYFRFFYWFTSNGLLFFTKELNAIPPLPEDLADEFGFIQDKKRLNEICEGLPNVFEYNPYEPDDRNHISWLKPGQNSKNFEQNDSIASKSFLRKVSLLIQAQGCIDLTRCVDISPLSNVDYFDEKTLKMWNGLNKSYWRADQSVRDTKQSIIKLKLENKRILLLMASNPFVCAEWVTRLRSLSSYWSARSKADKEFLWSMKNKNLRTFNIDETQEQNISASSPKWMSEKSSANELLLDTTTFAMARVIVHDGYIYHKSRKHAVFRKYLMILVPGFLVLYHCVGSSSSRPIKGFVGNTHYMTIPIQKCYIYSGSLTEHELLERNKDFNSIKPGSHGLFRVYEDGWKSIDEESSRTFVLWFPSKRLLLKRDEYNNLRCKTRGFKVVRKLGVVGRSMVFLCRSRQERDLWMTKLYEELERGKIL